MYGFICEILVEGWGKGRGRGRGRGKEGEWKGTLAEVVAQKLSTNNIILLLHMLNLNPFHMSQCSACQVSFPGAKARSCLVGQRLLAPCLHWQVQRWWTECRRKRGGGLPWRCGCLYHHSNHHPTRESVSWTVVLMWALIDYLCKVMKVFAVVENKAIILYLVISNYLINT